MHDLRYAAPAALRLERSRKESTPPLTLSTGTQLDSLSESDKGPDTSAAEPRTRAAAQVLLESLARDGVDPEVRQRLIDALRALTGVEPQADWSPEQTLQAFREAVDRLPE